MEILDYSSDFMENFAIGVLSNSFDNSYAKYIWRHKKDDFDFISPDGVTNAIEVASVISKNSINAREYELALNRGKKPDVNRVKKAHADKNGKLLTYYGGSMDEIRSE